jgi:hypothetical protein
MNVSLLRLVTFVKEDMMPRIGVFAHDVLRQSGTTTRRPMCVGKLQLVASSLQLIYNRYHSQ